MRGKKIGNREVKKKSGKCLSNTISISGVGIESQAQNVKWDVFRAWERVDI